jgi:RIO kinase 1
MHSVLEHLLSEGVISEVLGRLQSGKEAEVFVVLSQGNVVVAKVYKDRAHRSFKNNSSYKEGRAVKNSRSQRAMERGSKYGKAAAEDAWKSAEVDALYKLHAAQVRVPAPVMFFEGVLLMELVRDAEGNTAPRLIDTVLTPEQANGAYHDMLTQLVRMLSCELIHGDLSPYNVLWAAAGPTIIDFPQIISASHNNSSEQFFLRDAQNILGHLTRIDPTLASRRSDASEIWRAYVHRDLTPDFRPTGKPRPQRSFAPPSSPQYDPASRRPEPAQRRQPEPPARRPDPAQRRPFDGPPRAQFQTSRDAHPHAQRGNAAPSRDAHPHAQRGNAAPSRDAHPHAQRGNAAPGRPPAPRSSGGPRGNGRAPEVLFARPRRPGADSPTPVSPAARPWQSSPQRPALQSSTRPAPRPAPPGHGRPAAPWAPRAEPSRGSNEDSDRSRHRRRPPRRS